ncbi:MAG: LysR family transcriptional regulator [Paracoccaceae bacterium]
MRLRDRSLLPDLDIFVAIVRHGSMKAAAIELGVSTSALSHRMRKLEEALGVRLLNRTSRALAPTQAGATLAASLAQGFQTIDGALEVLSQRSGQPAGRLRLNLLQDAARLLLGPVLARYAGLFPRMHLDIHADDRIVDIVAGGFDAGIRYGDRVPQDMIGVALSPPTQWIVVGAEALIARVGQPQTPQDLASLPCIEMQLGDGSSYQWELGNGTAMMRVAVQGPLRANGTAQIIDAALQGLGFAYVLEHAVRDLIAAGRLRVVLPDWASEGPPFTIYYPSRHSPPGLRDLINLIRTDQGLSALAG